MRPALITYPDDGVKPIGIIEFVHGMCEKKERYAETMKIFSKYGFICTTVDLRGHGENIITKDDYGFFGEEMEKGLVEDVYQYTMFLKREYPGLPLILLGHSMGSLIVRAYLKKYSKNIEAAIISGSPSYNIFTAPGKILVKFIKLFKGERYRSPFVSSLVGGAFERKFKNEGIVNAWLSRDRRVVDEYNADPACGFTFTLNGYLSLLNLLSKVYAKAGWRSVNHNLPIMFMSGEEDPCMINEKAFKKSVTNLKHNGFKDVYYKLYPEMRHELFNELDNEEVYEDVLKFIALKVGVELVGRD